MDFSFDDTTVMIRNTVDNFVQRHLMPNEQVIIKREAQRGTSDIPIIPPELDAKLQGVAKEMGLWGIDVPQAHGGLDLGMLAKCLVVERLHHSVVPFVLPPDSPNLHLLEELCTGGQVEKYLLPYAKGEKRSSIALSEPGAGSDVANIATKAIHRNGKWTLNGTKLWISDAREADFIIVFAVTDKTAPKKGAFTAFLVDKGTRGLSIPQSYPTIGGYRPCEVVLDNVELTDNDVLGPVGGAFVPISRRLGVRRIEIAARCIGLATRCLSMMVEQANNRQTFGKLLADRQAVQWWISDSYQELEMVKLATYRAAWEMDTQSANLRRSGSLVKVQATEMLARVSDRAIQLFGGMGVSRELPLEYIYRMCRVMRIVEGPSEIHRWLIARDLLRNGVGV